MGQRISFYRNIFGKGLKDLILENYTTYRKWYFEEEKSALEEFGGNFGNENLKLFFKENTELDTDFLSLDITLINQLTSEFIRPFCDWTDKTNIILDHCGSSIYSKRYLQSSEMVQKTTDEEFIKLWSYLINGRSLIDNKEFIDYTNEFKIGYITYEEQIQLKQKIEYHFGNTETIKKKYWTFWEKLKEKRAIANSINGSYSLSGHNPKSSGLECVLQVLEEVKETKSDLISDIE